VIKKEAEKILQYEDLTIERAYWNVKTKVTPITIGTLEQLQNHPHST
jgi:hypothetical protein